MYHARYQELRCKRERLSYNRPNASLRDEHMLKFTGQSICIPTDKHANSFVMYEFKIK